MSVCHITKVLIFILKNIAVATVYTNLGDDAVVHAINETKSSIVVTSQELLPRFHKLLTKVIIGNDLPYKNNHEHYFCHYFLYLTPHKLGL